MAIPTKTRFDLENEINQCSNVCEDIKMLYQRIGDGYAGAKDLTPNELINILMGMEAIYNLRFELLIDTMCQVLELNEYKENRGNALLASEWMGQL